MTANETAGIAIGGVAVVGATVGQRIGQHLDTTSHQRADRTTHRAL